MPTACLKWPPLHGTETTISAKAIVFSQDRKRKESQNIFQLLESNQFQSPVGGAASADPDPDLTRCVLYKHVSDSKHSGNAFPKALLSHPGL